MKLKKLKKPIARVKRRLIIMLSLIGNMKCECSNDMFLWCTIKSSFNKGTIDGLIDFKAIKGFRFNLSKESNPERLSDTIRYIKQTDASKKILIDTGGSKQRISLVSGKYNIKKGEVLSIVTNDNLVSECQIGVSCELFGYITQSQKVGSKILISDGWQQFVITGIKEDNIICEALFDCELYTNRGISVSGLYDRLQQNYSGDVYKYNQLEKKYVDAIALSFVSGREAIDSMRGVIAEGTKICAKIESLNGLRNIYDISLASDMIMIARGDLLVELSYYHDTFLPIEKIIIEYSRLFNKPCIIATRIADSLETQDYISQEEAAVFGIELIKNPSKIQYLLANETTFDEKRTIQNVKKIIELASLWTKLIEVSDVKIS